GDEMEDLGAAFNDMMQRLQDLYSDLARQVNERSRQLVRSERLASVGFLAAGVAHEINNPLASIAMCAESLEGRIGGLLVQGNADHDLIANYLRMIQNEAFRCKEITEKLLDFSRMGEVKRQLTELGELVRGVVDILGHVDKYREKRIEVTVSESVVVSANPQELKQVVLNLLANGLDSLGAAGTVHVTVRQQRNEAEIVFVDNGCGMTPEVLEHLFEPFFTRRREGQGTGLGLSIVYRIVADHEGTIQAHSEGADRGSTFRVRLPLAAPVAQIEKEKSYRYQAA
ncbi:MAG: sensor histidine kinase, partial [Pirellulales bacterium]